MSSSASVPKVEDEFWWFTHRADAGDSESEKLLAWLAETEACSHTRAETAPCVQEVQVTVHVDQAGHSSLAACLNHSGPRHVDA